MSRAVTFVLYFFGSIWIASQANAQSTVECQSRNYQYGECYAGPLNQPQLIHQISSSACILNRTWGYNPQSKYIWVAQGRSGVFADVGGYHYGRGDGFDADARQYDSRGHDAGAVVAGAVLGAILGGLADSDRKGHQHTTSNFDYNDSGYNGCHGVGCMVDNPDKNGDQSIDPTPQFDKEGKPNFDERGNYQGCHGDGCLVDNPDDAN
ncbi:DUF3011 domain-containing protein [Brucella cytisi]|uniref:Glycine zipper 2TM domain-containing protein n=1 Tax=Brucella cytisi TaxID=407152 RepID=A0A1J6HRI8_9HYPH|nr:DUF3011 domain-containing protein [Brucella cytisi]OIS90807.1 hypothetical protein BLA27_24690 [Brucella cytisi]